MRLIEFVKKASKDAVIDGARQIKRFHIPYGRIISGSNPFVRNGVKAIKKHNDPGNNYQIPQTKVVQFLAASSISHMLDGWMYLSNAFNALLNGDEGTAVHLAYYAELRSGMSILSTEGIGVFSSKHIAAFDSGVGLFPSGGNRQKNPTHQFIWEAFEKWSTTSTKPNDEILKIFKVRGLTFYEIMEFFHPSTASSNLITLQIVKKWLNEWFFDVKNFRRDRENRNEASYRPQRIDGFIHEVDLKQIITELARFWNVISPTSSSAFDLLDTYLLRKLLTSVYQQVDPNQSQPLEDRVSNAFGQRGIYDQELINFIIKRPPYEDEHAIFTHASMKSAASFAIFARATLLLRVSVGLVSQLYRAAAISKDDLRFVWNKYGIDSGFWIPASPIADFEDLWTDSRHLLEDLITDVNQENADNSLFSVRNRRPIELQHLSQINRACLWGLDL
jgi:hypothetical protein